MLCGQYLFWGGICFNYHGIEWGAGDAASSWLYSNIIVLMQIPLHHTLHQRHECDSSCLWI